MCIIAGEIVIEQGLTHGVILYEYCSKVRGCFKIPCNEFEPADGSARIVFGNLRKDGNALAATDLCGIQFMFFLGVEVEEDIVVEVLLTVFARPFYYLPALP